MNWKTPVVVRLDGEDVYNGSDVFEAHRIIGTITFVLVHKQVSGDITVIDATDAVVYRENV